MKLMIDHDGYFEHIDDCSDCPYLSRYIYKYRNRICTTRNRAQSHIWMDHRELIRQENRRLSSKPPWHVYLDYFQYGSELCRASRIVLYSLRYEQWHWRAMMIEAVYCIVRKNTTTLHSTSFRHIEDK